MDFEVWRERFRDWLAVRFASGDTVRNYVAGMEPFWEFAACLGLRSWTEATRDVLEEYRTRLFYSRHHKTGRPLGVGTHVARLLSVKTFFRFLVSEGFLLANPSAHLEFPRQKKPLPLVLSEAEVGKLLEVPDLDTLFGIRDRTLVEVLYGTGLRNAELCSLTLDQVDLGSHLIRLQKGKGNKGRVLPLGEVAQEWLERYLETVRPQWLRNPALTAVFLDRWGHKALARNGLTQIIRELGRRANLGKAISPHVLRHSCATHMLKRGASLRHLQQLLGHSSLTSTEHYTRVEVSDLRRVLARCHPREMQ